MPPATDSPSPAQVAWAAGFFDGEGSVYLKRSHERHLPAVVVGNTVRLPLEELQRWYGGTIYAMKVKDGRRPCWAWQVSGARGVRPFLLSVREHLRVKRQQADVMLDFCELIASPGGRPTSPENLAEREVLTRRIAELKAA